MTEVAYMTDDEPVYWIGHLGIYDDFGVPYTDEMFDAPTLHGPWANMTRESWERYRATPRLGTGYGQRYMKDDTGRWKKVEG